MDVTVVIATYGEPRWLVLADRAERSARTFDVPVVREHGENLHGARNDGLARVETEWTCFLDADDELEPGFFDAIAIGTCDLRAPAVRYVRGSVSRNPARVPNVAGHTHDCTAECLSWGNWLVIGTVAPTALLREVGGFRDFDWSEDWDLWVRCWQAGATIEAVPEAVYRAHVRPNSRNRAPSRLSRLESHRAIARANGLPVPV